MLEGRAIVVMWNYVAGLDIAVNAVQSEASWFFFLFSSLSPSRHFEKYLRSESSFMNSNKLFSSVYKAYNLVTLQTDP